MANIFCHQPLFLGGLKQTYSYGSLSALEITWLFFFHHHQELKPRPLSQNVLKFLEMSTNNVLQKSSQILRSLSSREYCWVCCCFFHRKYSVQYGWSSSQAKQSSFVRQNFLTNIRHSGSFAIASTPVCEHKKTIT